MIFCVLTQNKNGRADLLVCEQFEARDGAQVQCAFNNARRAADELAARNGARSAHVVCDGRRVYEAR